MNCSLARIEYLDIKLAIVMNCNVPSAVARLSKMIGFLRTLDSGTDARHVYMGRARFDTFTAHLKWMSAIALGYAASIGVDMALNADLF